jgi:tetratricopeptide (TPR) repeat protein
MNNCGPANLAMALSYWKWQGTQVDTAAYLKPNQDDKNVMPYEMADFVTTQTNLKVAVRLGGDMQTLKRLIAGGFPVIIEKGYEGASFPGWMGHYEVLSGYDDVQALFTAQDSYEGPNRQVTYDKMLSNWRAFDFIFLVIYPPENESDLLAILGPLADEQAAFEQSAQVALNETGTLKDRDLYFAWFNRGTSLVKLGDYGGAAAAYDQAFNVYPNIVEDKRPWRMLWYQTGPYFAYYYTGRYNDIVSLATQSLDAANIPTLEESYVWRARAEVMLGQRDQAIADLRLALKYHPGFEAALGDLQQLGVTP